MRRFSLFQFACVLLICTTLVSVAISLYVSRLTRTLETETLLALQEFAAQDVQHIKMQVTEDLDLLGSIATSISILPDPTEKEMLNLLDAQRTQNHFKNMELVDANGIAHLNDGTLLDVSKESHLQSALAGTPTISEQVKDMLDGKNIIVEAVPVFQKGKITNVLMATRDTTEFAQLLNMQSFNGEGYSLLVDTDGNKVMESFHKNALPGLYNIFDMPDDPNHALRHQVLRDFAAHKSGVIKYQSTKRGVLYISYQPLDINDWYLIAVVPEKHLVKVTHNFITLLPLLCILIAAAFFCLGGYMWYAWPLLKQRLSAPEA